MPSVNNKSQNLKRERELAWIGDAALALYAREWILKQPDILPGERIEVFTRMTSNKFLAGLGQPTAMEAKIGQAYEDGGLSAAYTHIESEILPVFKKQRANRLRGGRK